MSDTHQTYSAEYLNELLQQSKVEEAKAYILRFHYKLGIGKYVGILDENGVNIIPTIDLKHNHLTKYDVTPSKAGNAQKPFRAFDWFQNGHRASWRLVQEYQAPRVNHEKRELNQMSNPLHLPNTVKPFKEYKETTREMTEKVLSHIREVWCSSSKEQYDYVMSWLSCIIVAGKKQRTALYLKSVQGTGKGTIIEFLLTKVLGSGLGFSTDSTESINGFNEQLAGKLLVNYDELPCATVGEWKQTHNNLKKLISDNMMSTRGMYKERNETTKNTMNVILTTNNQAVKIDHNSRRYVALDVSPKYVRNHDYFAELHKITQGKYSRAVGECFYAWLVENYNEIKNSFNCDKYPITQTYLDEVRCNIPSILGFIKKEFILRGNGLDMLQSVFKENAEAYLGIRTLKNTDLKQQLSVVGLKSSRKRVGSGGKRPNCLKFSHKALVEAFKSSGFLSQDEVEDLE